MIKLLLVGKLNLNNKKIFISLERKSSGTNESFSWLYVYLTESCFITIVYFYSKNISFDKPDKASSSSTDGEGQTTPNTTQQTNHSQLAPPFFIPEPSLHRAIGIQTQLSCDSPVHGSPSPTTTGTDLFSEWLQDCWASFLFALTLGSNHPEAVC